MDELVKKIAAMGIPGIILIVAMSATGLSGAAALTAALAALGPFGMIGGIALLGMTGLIADKVAEFGYEKVTMAVIKEQLKNITPDDMKKKVHRYPISRGMKNKIIENIDKANLED